MVDPVIKRIEDAATSIEAAAQTLADNVQAEVAQFAIVIENLRGSATNPALSAEASAELAATADKLEASVAKLKASADAVKGIVPDADVPAPTPSGTVDNPPAVGLAFDVASATAVAGTGFEVKVVALDKNAEPAKGYTGTLRFSSDSVSASDVLPADHVYGTDNNLAVLFVAAGTYVLTVVDAGNPSITAGKLTVTVAASGVATEGH